MRALVIAEHKADTIKAGFHNAGYKIVTDNRHPQPDDVLVAWNRKPRFESTIRLYENAGAKVIIVENGYIGRDNKGNRLLSLAHNHHLGKGRWFVGEEPRHLNHNFSVMPWREGGEEIVLLAQRGIGDSQRHEWYEHLAKRIRKTTCRPVRVRAHPGKNMTPLEPDIENAHAVVTYSSGAALYALAFGVPVFYIMPGWIGAGACRPGVDALEFPHRGDREAVFHRIGWAQWTQKEIISGDAIRTVMKA